MIQFSDILDSPAYIINLDVATDRFIETSKNIKDAGFTCIERVSGIHASQIGEERLSTEWAKHGSPEFKKDGIPEILLDVHIGRKGIMLSQLHIWKMISEMENVDDDAIFTIFEDDVVFHSNWSELAPLYSIKTPSDFDILFMGNQLQIINPDGNLTSILSNKHVCRVPSFCLHAYVITKRGAKKIYDAVLAYPGGIYTIDLMLFDMMRELNGSKCPFNWYCWNVAKFFHCEKHNGEELLNFHRVRNNGLVFQNHLFESYICKI
jgi:GR25 family glycosyltransferase involved in LPS biosynthesis